MTDHPPEIAIDELLRHSSWVQRLARSLVGPEAAEDLTQQTWLSALRRPPHGHGRERAWLASVLRNHARDRAREDHRRQRRAAAALDLHKEALPPEQVLARAELQTRLAQSVLTLPDGQRSVLLLRYFEDLPPRKIAAALDLPVETVRKRLQRSLAALRRRLEVEDGPDWQRAFLALLPGMQDPPSGFPRSEAALRHWLLAKPVTVLCGVLLLVVAAIVFTPNDSSPVQGFGVEATGNAELPDLTPAPVSGELVKSTRLLLGGTAHRTRGELRSAGEPLQEYGVLLAAWPDPGIRVEVPVANGDIPLPADWGLSPSKPLPSPGRFRLLLPGSPCSQVHSLHWQEDDGTQVLVFELGSEEVVRVLVTDLLGDPIPATNIRFGLPFLDPQDVLGARTGQDGVAEIRVFGRTGSLVVEAEAPGYLAKQDSLAAEDRGGELHFELGRILAFGLVFDPTSGPLSPYTVGWRDRRAGHISRLSPMQSEFLEEHEPGLELRPGEQLRWVLGSELFERLEDAWTTLSLEGEEEQRVPLLPLIDGTPELLRIADSGSDEGRSSVRIRLEPREAFPLGFPETFVMSFQRLEGDTAPQDESDPLDRQARRERIRSMLKSKHTGRVGRRVGPQEYQFFLEPGEYRVGSTRSALDGRALLEEFRLVVPTDASTVATIRKDTRSMKLSFLDPGGFPVLFDGDLRAAAEPPDPRRTRMAWPGTGARSIFLGPGEYRFWWGMPLQPTAHLLRWPEDGWTVEGPWWVPLPAELFEEVTADTEAMLKQRRGIPRFRTLEEQDEWMQRGMADFSLQLD